MEFKQPTRYSRVPPRPNMPPQGENTASPATRPTQTTSGSIPPIKKPDTSRIRTFLLAKRTLVITSALVLIILAWVIISLITQHAQSKTSTIIKDPGYQTILPAGTSITKLGGWERVSPPESAPVFAYADTIGTTPISVSEQPLPQSFIDDGAAHVAELAKAYNATDKIDVSGTTVYIGTSAKGPQSVIFTKDNLLILIKSHAKIDDKAWVQYITSLS